MYIMDFQVKCENECENVVPKRRKRTFSSGSDSKLPFLSKVCFNIFIYEYFIKPSSLSK